MNNSVDLTLKNQRKQYEAGLFVLFQVPNGTRGLSVILIDDNGDYNAFYYEHTGLDKDDDRWDVTPDVSAGTGNDVVDSLTRRYSA